MATVTVTERIEASSDPVFIIKVTGPEDRVRYYVTKAVWEYEASRASTPKQVAGCAAIAEAFEALGPPELHTMSAPWWPAPPEGGNRFTHTDASVLLEPGVD